MNNLSRRDRQDINWDEEVSKVYGAFQPASSLTELLALQDIEFVVVLYLTLLRRQVDAEGFKYYLGRVRAGYSKVGIVAQIALSNEFISKKIRIPGLDGVVKREKMKRNVLIRWLVSGVSGSESDRPIERNIRSLDNKLSVFLDLSQHRLDSVERQVSSVFENGSDGSSARRDNVAKPNGQVQHVNGNAEFHSNALQLISPRSLSVLRKITKASFQSNFGKTV